MVLATSPTPPVSSAQLQPSTSMCLRQTYVSSRLFLRVFEKGTGVSDIWELEKQAAGNTSARLEEKKAHFHRNSKHQKSRIYTQKRQDELSAAFRFWSLYSDDSEKSLFISRESFWVSEKERWVFDFFFILKTRVIFLGLCKKRSPRNNHVMDFQFISIRRHIYEGFPSWIELEENFRLKPRKNLQHKYDNSVTLWLWLCWKPPRLQLKSKPWYDLPEKVNANQKATKNISGYFSTVSVFACERIFIKTAGWSFVVYRLSDEPEPTEITNAILVFFFFLGPVVWLDKCSEALEALKLVWIILLKMTVWHFFFFITERESSERRNTSSRLKQKFSDNLNWTCCELCTSKDNEYGMEKFKFKQHVIQDLQGFFLWVNNQLQTLKMTLFTKK